MGVEVVVMSGYCPKSPRWVHCGWPYAAHACEPDHSFRSCDCCTGTPAAQPVGLPLTPPFACTAVWCCTACLAVLYCHCLCCHRLQASRATAWIRWPATQGIRCVCGHSGWSSDGRHLRGLVPLPGITSSQGTGRGCRKRCQGLRHEPCGLGWGQGCGMLRAGERWQQLCSSTVCAVG
jgi:hypothetical protein